jgi:hypothetical protein
MYPQAKNTVNYVKSGWHVAVAYVVGFFVMLWVVGWEPHEPYKKGAEKEIPVLQSAPQTLSH